KLIKGNFKMELLNGQKIGISEEAYVPHISELKLNKPNVTLFEQDDELIDYLYKGKVGFALVDVYAASYWNINSSQHIVDCGAPAHFESAIAIAVNPKDNELLERVNWALTSYQNSQNFLDDYNKYLIYFKSRPVDLERH
ncbi:MAG: transporter substrate-binding domain-containing protein, partial [Gammaproteobacteria bacterium]|nr:transporter substrate-binding domain-containing protein [Gammaproteobacteria bacterium]